VGESALGVHSEAPFTLRMAKAMADPLRIKILLELNQRDMSATQFHEAFGGGSVTRVYRHFKVLAEYGWLVKVGEKSGGQRRGATEHFYRATRPAMFDNESWASLPESMQNSVTWQAFETLMERVRDAMGAGTIDLRDDRHVSWTPAFLDQLGWENVVSRVDAVFGFLFEEQARAKLRMAESGEESIPVTVALAVFESPPDSFPARPGEMEVE
jgi:DNA-binding transcriptional ArsR family regulator